MNGKQIQINGRGAISFLLAVLILVVVATPALAWEDEGGPSSQLGRPQTVGLEEDGGNSFRYCSKISPRITSGTPALQPSLARAE